MRQTHTVLSGIMGSVQSGFVWNRGPKNHEKSDALSASSLLKLENVGGQHQINMFVSAFVEPRSNSWAAMGQNCQINPNHLLDLCGVM